MSYEFIVELLFFFILLSTIFFYLTVNFTHWKIREVNGPQPLPIFGNLIRVVLRQTSLENYLKELYEKYNVECMVGFFAGFEPILLLKDLDLIKDVLTKDISAFSVCALTSEKVEGFTTSLLTVCSERLNVLGSKISTAFSSDTLERMFYLLAGCAEQFEEHLNKIVAKSEIVDCYKLMETFTTDVIGTCVFGLETRKLNDNEMSIFMQMCKKIMCPSTGKLLARKMMMKSMPWLYKIIKNRFVDQGAYKFFASIIAQTLKDRKTKKIVKQDFLDIFLDLQNHPENFPELELTDDVIAAQAIAFSIAIFNPCSITTSRALFELAENQDIQERLREEINREVEKTNGVINHENLQNMIYLDLVLKETLRKYPAVTYITRKSLGHYRFTGTKVVIPSGQKVWIPVYAIHRDPNIYPSPEVFDPERFRKEDFESANPMSYLPFGDGSRNCIGTDFAIYHMKLALVKTLKAYKLDVCEKPTMPHCDEFGKDGTMPKSRILVKMTKINNN